MIRDEAEQLCRQLNQRFAGPDAADVAVVEVLSQQAEFHAPGGGRPTFVRYKIRLTDGSRTATVSLDEARELLAVEDPAGPERVLSLAVERGWEVEGSG